NALAAQTGGIPFAEGFVVVAVVIGELLLILRLSAIWRNGDKTGRSVGDRRNLLVWIVAIVCAAIAAFFCVKYLWFLSPNAKGAGLLTWFLILPLIVVTLTGGLLLFRLAVTRDSKAPFRLAIFKEEGAAHGGRALYLLASSCLLLAVSIDCGIHAIARHSGFNDTLPFLQLPILVAILAGAVFLLRVAAVEIGAQESSNQSSEERSVLRKLERLMVGLKWVADWLKGKVGDTRDTTEWVRGHREPLLTLVASTCMLLSLGLGWSMHMPGGKAVPTFSQSSSSLAPVLLGICLVLLKTTVVRLKKTDNPTPRKTKSKKRTWADKHRSALLWGLATSSVVLAVWTGWVARAVVSDASREYHGTSMALTSPTFIGIVLCVTFVIFEMRWGEGENRRSLWLLTSAYVVLVALLTVSLSEQTQMMRLIQAIIGLMAAALAWVVGLGWMADPNAYSMHLFYKARLVRAYLGASNFNRLKQQKEITEAVAGDNVLLKEMRNCGRGAPYHLINTTLNLVASRDLATAQRSAASFVLSQLHCGSTRTGYRATGKYMGGRLTLGTAVAVSGAATSPNMGSRTPTAALAMLMTLLNVRLGYWAPTPKNPDWKSPRARLWPFYLLREFLSHTNDVSDYCYLTDGGHFDNTGLYSLVERGCRFIVVADCGADPEPSFSDLGNAIRRCHIDFGAEIELNITPFKKLVENRATQHFVKGKIVYSKAHAKALEWGEVESEHERTGTIILIKPSLLSDKKSDETADVRQYAIQNSDFPQQTTTKQWFDEAQFESYRRLGEICVQSIFCDLDDGGNSRTKEAVERIKDKIERRAGISTKDIGELFYDTTRATVDYRAQSPQFE
ncbi:MAG TPA: hypothetical protein VFF31_18885, partial [Blastocatellia bacterium]|nr:hypothetical protein [Blastocatellia bacterium]